MFTLFIIFVLAFYFILIALLFAFLIKRSQTRKSQNAINFKANHFLKNANFKISKKFYITDFASYAQPVSIKKFIAIDSENEKICLIDYNSSKMIIINFDEFLNYEIYENGGYTTTGAEFAGLFGAQTAGMCKDLRLIIRLQRYDISQISYEIVFDTFLNLGISKTSNQYQSCISSLQEVVSLLEVIKNKNNKN